MKKTALLVLCILPMLASCSKSAPDSSKKEGGSLYGDFILERYADGFRVNDYRGNEKRIVIPDTVEVESGEKVPVVSLSSNCFALRDQIEEVVLGDNIKTIEAYAFAHSSIKKLYVNTKLETISQDAFVSSKVQMNVVDGISYLPTVDSEYGYLLGGTPTTLLTKDVYQVNIPEGCQVIYRNAFGGYVGKITIPSTVKIIGQYAFNNANIAYEASWENLEKIGNHAFYNTQALKFKTNGFADYTKEGYRFDFGTSLKEIGAEAFLFKSYSRTFVGAEAGTQGVITLKAKDGTYGATNNFATGYLVKYLS